MLSGNVEEPKGPEQPTPPIPSGKAEEPKQPTPPVTPKKPPLERAPADQDLIPAEPSNNPSPATPKPIDSGLLEQPQERLLAAAAPNPAEAAPPAKLQADWATAFYPESMAGGQLRLIDQAEAPAAGEDVRLASYSDAPVDEPAPLLEGYCPVQLCDHERWVRGDPRYKVTHGGQTLLLSGPAERQRFLASPWRYLPACGGNDPVLEAEEGRHVPGTPEHSAIYNQRLHLFASAATLAKFRDNPQRYVSREP